MCARFQQAEEKIIPELGKRQENGQRNKRFWYNLEKQPVHFHWGRVVNKYIGKSSWGQTLKEFVRKLMDKKVEFYTCNMDYLQDCYKYKS